MISFVCWKWSDPRAGRAFSSSHVNTLARAIARHYDAPHRVLCVTDDQRGLSPNVLPIPMPRTGFEDLLNPSQTQRTRGVEKPFPSCYRRLWNFSSAARALLGDRIFALDIDVIVLGDLRPLVTRSASFVGWCDPRFQWDKVAGGAYLLTTGAHVDVYDEFDPLTSPAIAKAAGFEGSDQAWMSYKLYPPRQHWSSADGLIKLNWLRNAETPPPGTRLIFTSGDRPPWDSSVQMRHPWIKEYWR